MKALVALILTPLISVSALALTCENALLATPNGGESFHVVAQCDGDMATIAGDYDQIPTAASVCLIKGMALGKSQTQILIVTEDSVGRTTDTWYPSESEITSSVNGFTIKAKQNGIFFWDQNKRSLSIRVNGTAGSLVLKSRPWGLFRKWNTELALGLRCSGN